MSRVDDTASRLACREYNHAPVRQFPAFSRKTPENKVGWYQSCNNVQNSLIIERLRERYGAVTPSPVIVAVEVPRNAVRTSSTLADA